MNNQLNRALSDLGRGVRKREHNRRKRSVEGVMVKPQPKSAREPYDPYHRTDEQIAQYQERAKSQFKDD